MYCSGSSYSLIICDLQVTCLQFSGSRIVSGSDDNTLRVWNAITGRVINLYVPVHVSNDA